MSFLRNLLNPPRPDTLMDAQSYFSRWDRANRAALDAVQARWPDLELETQEIIAKEISFAAVRGWENL